MDQFIDLCILSGCDYCENIKGVPASYVFLHTSDIRLSPQYDVALHDLLKKLRSSENVKAVSLY